MPPPPSTEFIFAIGAVLVIAGLWLTFRHRRTRAAREADASLSDAEREFYRRQLRRRTITSVLLILLGILVPIGDMLFGRGGRPEPLPLTIYWGGVLLLVLLMLGLAVADLVMTGRHTRKALNRIRSEQAALEHELQDFRRSRGRNRP